MGDDVLFPDPYEEETRSKERHSSWGDNDLASAFRRVTGDEPVKPFNWIVKGMIERGKAGILFGQNQSYKSFFILALAAHLMAGRRFAGRRTKARGQTVVYVPFEGESSVDARFREARRALGLNASEARLEVMRAKPFSTDEGYRFFEDALRHYVDRYDDISLVVIDTVNQAKFFDGTPGNSENDPAAWGRVYGFLKRVADELDLTIMLVHHAGKDLSSGGRGSSANTDDADFALTISSEKDQVTGKSVNHWLHQSKIKDGGSSGPICAIIPHEVELGTDEDGDRITTLTLEFDEEATYSPPSDGIWRGKSKSGEDGDHTLTGECKALMDALANVSENEPEKLWQDNHGSGAAKVLIPMQVARMAYDKARGVTAESPHNVKEASRKAFNRALKKLRDADKIDPEGGAIKIL